LQHTTTRLPNLDAIRFWAAMLVFLGHGLSPVFSQQGWDKGWAWQFWQSISSGQTGVSVFFVLSGFLISYLLLKEWETRGSVAVGKFYMRRILRIWPLYYALLLFNFLLYPIISNYLGNIGTTVADWRYHLFFLSNFDLLHIYSAGLTPHILIQDINWSIAIEEQFYLFWPLLFLLPKKTWKYLLLAILVSSLIFRINYQADVTFLYFHSLSNLFDLAIGGFFAYLIQYHAKFRAFFENIHTKGHFLLFLITGLLVYFQFDWRYLPYGEAIGHPVLATAFAAIIGAQAFSSSPSIFHLGHFSFANYWGKYTYGFYLLHPIALAAADIGLRALQFNTAQLGAGLLMATVGLLLSFLLSWLSYEVFEKWFLKWRGRFSS
jgi:peptidoglycan/LPS O-acetylase OafA/YrhL